MKGDCEGYYLWKLETVLDSYLILNMKNYIHLAKIIILYPLFSSFFTLVIHHDSLDLNWSA